MMIDYPYVGGPLNGKIVRAREDTALCRDQGGSPLPASVADAAVAKMNRGREPGPVYVRFSGRYIWLPERAAQLRAEREDREVRQASRLDRAQLDVAAKATPEMYLRLQAEQQRRRAARRGAGRGTA
jgi:hypothetical protein